jgi:hypothetical protein
MGGAQENHGLLTQNAQQQSMGQGRLHIFVDPPSPC